MRPIRFHPLALFLLILAAAALAVGIPIAMLMQSTQQNQLADQLERAGYSVGSVSALWEGDTIVTYRVDVATGTCRAWVEQKKDETDYRIIDIIAPTDAEADIMPLNATADQFRIALKEVDEIC